MPIAYPYKFSDWYGYDKDCTTTTSFSSGSGQADAKVYMYSICEYNKISRR